MSGQELAVSLLRGNWTYFPSICWRTETVRRRGFDPAFDVVLDLALQLDIVLDGGDLVLLPEHTFRYRRHDRSASSVASDDRRFGEEAQFFADVARTMDSAGWPAASRAARRHWTSRLHALAAVPATVRARDLPRARRLVGHAVR